MISSNRVWVLTLIIFVTASACSPSSGTHQASPDAQPTAAAIPAPSSISDPYGARVPAVIWDQNGLVNQLIVVDSATREPEPDFPPISLGRYYFYALSPDRRQLAVTSFSNELFTNGVLLLVDLKTWRTQEFDAKLRGGYMVFSPDGSRLAIASGEQTSRLAIFDFTEGSVTAEKELDFLIWRFEFTSNGELLMLYGPVVQDRFTANEMNGGAPQVHLLDAADLSTHWSAELKGVRDGIFPKDENNRDALMQFENAMYLLPATAFAPDRDALHIVHADSDQLTTVDFAAREVETFKIQPRLGWFERLLSLTAGVAHAKVGDGSRKHAVPSPDGRFLYVVGERNSMDQDGNGDWQMSHTPLGLNVIQTSDGSLITHIETEAVDLSLSPDGRYLYLRHWGSGENDSTPWTEVLDSATHKVIARRTEMYAAPVLAMNGQPVLVSTHSLTEDLHRMSIMQTDGRKLLAVWTGPDYVTWLTTP